MRFRQNSIFSPSHLNVWNVENGLGLTLYRRQCRDSLFLRDGEAKGCRLFQCGVPSVWCVLKDWSFSRCLVDSRTLFPKATLYRCVKARSQQLCRIVGPKKIATLFSNSLNMNTGQIETDQWSSRIRTSVRFFPQSFTDHWYYAGAGC